nr:MAG TPA: hypothetical protein [Caudoviricetes sp.]
MGIPADLLRGFSQYFHDNATHLIYSRGILYNEMIRVPGDARCVGGVRKERLADRLRGDPAGGAI